MKKMIANSFLPFGLFVLLLSASCERSDNLGSNADENAPKTENKDVVGSDKIDTTSENYYDSAAGSNPNSRAKSAPDGLKH